ncbi:MAG: sulfurtransferase-like selenium metabolism protein YedF [Clostridiaceae bacterium]
MHIIDCKGLKCPEPVINTKKYLDSIAEGEAQIVVDNQTASENVSKLCKSLGVDFKTENKDGLFYVYAKKQECITCNPMTFDDNLVIFIGKSVLGSGDDKLGEILMKSYMFALSESDKIPKTLIFVNGGVKLTTEGSNVIESLRSLKAKGTEILSCGTCLDFYNLQDKLLIGEISNMYTIIEKMNNGSNMIVL